MMNGQSSEELLQPPGMEEDDLEESPDSFCTRPRHNHNAFS
jgi:hypothetical protein